MAKSIHLKCVRDDGRLRGLTAVDQAHHLYKSVKWEILESDAANLVGGWVYFHPTKAERSEFGGKVVEITLLDTLSAHGNPKIGIIFEARNEAKGVEWRGANHQMAWRSGLVESDLPHERQ